MHSLHRSGFSLIELMIVITIISILSAIAFPSYQFYIQRARFAEIITVSDMFKTAVTLALQEGYSLNEITTDTDGIPPAPLPTKNLQSLKIENGIITTTATSLIKNATYILTPENNGDTWRIGGTCLQYGLCNKEA